MNRYVLAIGGGGAARFRKRGLVRALGLLLIIAVIAAIHHASGMAGARRERDALLAANRQLELAPAHGGKGRVAAELA